MRVVNGQVVNNDDTVTPVIMNYAEQRAVEYPKIGDQLDAILKQLQLLADNNQLILDADLASILAKCSAVKSKYPQPK